MTSFAGLMTVAAVAGVAVVLGLCRDTGPCTCERKCISPDCRGGVKG